MSFSLPPGFQGAIAGLIHGLGSDAVFTPQDPPGAAGIPLRVSIQAPGTDNLVHDQDQAMRSVYVNAPDLSVQPQKFDRITLAGEEHTVEDVLPIQASGRVLAWVLLVKGG
jgi:hypothetical protein